MATPTSSAEVKKQNSSALESINESIRQQENEGALAVQEAAGETQREVADIMRQKSEKIGERGEKRDFGGGGAAATKKDDDDQTVVTGGATQVTFPPQAVMASKLVNVIRNEIKLEMKNAARLEKKLATGGAKDYNESIARIRTLKSTLQSLLDATVDFLKDLYVRYVVNGKGRRGEVAAK